MSKNDKPEIKFVRKKPESSFLIPGNIEKTRYLIKSLQEITELKNDIVATINKSVKFIRSATGDLPRMEAPYKLLISDKIANHAVVFEKVFQIMEESTISEKLQKVGDNEPYYCIVGSVLTTLENIFENLSDFHGVYMPRVIIVDIDKKGILKDASFGFQFTSEADNTDIIHPINLRISFYARDPSEHPSFSNPSNVEEVKEQVRLSDEELKKRLDIN